MIGVRDIGLVGARAVCDPERWVGRGVELAGDELTMDELREKYQRVSGYDVRWSWEGLLPVPCPGGRRGRLARKVLDVLNEIGHGRGNHSNPRMDCQSNQMGRILPTRIFRGMFGTLFPHPPFQEPDDQFWDQQGFHTDIAALRDEVPELEDLEMFLRRYKAERDELAQAQAAEKA